MGTWEDHLAERSMTHRWQVAFATIAEMFRDTAQACPDRPYCKSSEVTLNYAQATSAINALAQDLGPSVQGRTVALVLPNSTAFLVAYFAVLEAGAYPALVNHAHPDATVNKLLNEIDLAAVLSDREIPELDVTHIDDAFVADLASRQAGTNAATLPAPHETGAILFSGGTTGLPKQIAHSNKMLVAAVERMEWGWPTYDNEIWLPVAPFTHVYGFLMGVLNPVLRGGTVVIPPRFHPDLIVDLLHAESVTVFGGGPPAIYQAILASEKFASAAFPKLRVCPGGGAPFPLDLHRRWNEATGLPITEGYGMTEMAPICVNTDSDGILPGAAGKAVPDSEIEIVDIKTGKTVLPIGESGEIRIKGPHMMAGYTNNPEETAITIRDGFVYTGDIGRLDESGFLIISDRKKDVMLVKGFNVFPREVEEALLSHPSVSGACVVGRQDSRAGEVPIAYVTLRSDVSSSALLDFLAVTLADYKMPAECVFLDAFPMTAAAKVDRTALRAKANEALQ